MAGQGLQGAGLAKKTALSQIEGHGEGGDVLSDCFVMVVSHKSIPALICWRLPAVSFRRWFQEQLSFQHHGFGRRGVDGNWRYEDKTPEHYFRYQYPTRNWTWTSACLVCLITWLHFIPHREEVGLCRFPNDTTSNWSHEDRLWSN